jgi:hypothetical protein
MLQKIPHQTVYRCLYVAGTEKFLLFHSNQIFDKYSAHGLTALTLPSDMARSETGTRFFENCRYLGPLMQKLYVSRFLSNYIVPDGFYF